MTLIFAIILFVVSMAYFIISHTPKDELDTMIADSMKWGN